MNIDYCALVNLIEDNWEQFVAYCGSEEVAEDTLAEMKKESGMS